MKSTEVYKTARPVLAPWCKQNGFKRTTGGMLGWYKPVDEDFLVFWLQCGQTGWNGYAGSDFCVEFQYSPSPHIGGGGYQAGGERHRLPYFLTAEELEEVRSMQNRVIAKLEKPPADHFAFQISESISRSYMSKFVAEKTAYTSRHDIWFRYKDEEDVTLWAEFVARLLPRITSQIESRSV